MLTLSCSLYTPCALAVTFTAVRVCAANCVPKRDCDLTVADHEASVQDTEARRQTVRRIAGISAAGMTQFLQRVPAGFLVEKLRQVRCCCCMYVHVNGHFLGVYLSVCFACALCVQIGYAHQHCGAHGIYPEICGWVISVLMQLVWPEGMRRVCDMAWVNRRIASVNWSCNDSMESVTQICDDMVAETTKKCTETTRVTLKSRNSAQSVLYLSVLSAALNYYCDFVLPREIAKHGARVDDNATVKLVRACRDFLALVGSAHFPYLLTCSCPC